MDESWRHVSLRDCDATNPHETEEEMTFQMRPSMLAVMLMLVVTVDATYPLSASGQASTTPSALTMNINPHGNPTVLPDKNDLGYRERYWDYRYRDQQLPSDYCVQGTVYSTGDIGISLNRRMPAGHLCAADEDTGLDPNIYANGVEPRAYQLRIESPDACAALHLPIAAGACIAMTLSGPTAGMPQVHAGGLFKSKVVRVPMTFYFALANNGDLSDARIYNLKMDSHVPITFNGINVKRVGTSNATATLSQSVDGRYRTVAVGIPMRFDISFERVSAAPQ